MRYDFHEAYLNKNSVSIERQMTGDHILWISILEEMKLCYIKLKGDYF